MLERGYGSMLGAGEWNLDSEDGVFVNCVAVHGISGAILLEINGGATQWIALWVCKKRTMFRCLIFRHNSRAHSKGWIYGAF